MSSNRIVWLSETDSPDAFPDIENALAEPDGLLAAGGDLSSERLLAAYAAGIFPWHDEGQPILWWSPDPRCILRPADYHVSQRLKQYLRRSRLSLRFNTAFNEVIRACAGERKSEQGTWITSDMMRAYEGLHRDRWAHSIEVWDKDALLGGLYGIGMGRAFFGESMFSATDNASKFAMLGLSKILQANDCNIIDCQVVSQHLISLGATMISRAEFTQELRSACVPATRLDFWPDGPISVAELPRD